MKQIICLKIKCGKKINIETIQQSGDMLENKNVYMFSAGSIFDINQNTLDLKKIYTLYKKYGTNIINYLDGIYSLIIIDKNINKLYVFQDYFGNNQNIYFHKNNKEIMISNELKQITKKDADWKLNHKGIKKFLSKGFITNNKTLVKNVYKIPAKKYLQVNLNNAKCKVRKKIYNNNIYKIKNVNTDIYYRTIEEICSKLKCDNMGITISSGYDTNFLMYNLRKQSNKNLKAFCIGGVIGRNEVPSSKFICENYKDIDFYSKLVDGTSLMNFPEIVYALEGAIYESGIFLQYELAKLIKKNKIKNMIFGECADQVLHYNFHHPYNSYIDKIKYYIKNISQICKGITIKPFKDVYEMASFKILKKNGILMNYYGIDTQYPYLRRKFIETANKVVIKGDNDKKYHKETINKTLPTEVVKILKKIGGATELKTLFVGKISLEDIKHIAQNSKFYKKRKFNDEYYEIDYFMKIIYLEIFEQIFLNEKEILLNDKINDYNLVYFFPELNKEE